MKTDRQIKGKPKYIEQTDINMDIQKIWGDRLTKIWTDGETHRGLKHNQ